MSHLNFLLLNHGKRPWKVSVFPAFGGVSGRDDNVDTIRIAAEKRTIEIGADFNAYTDGSASGGLLDGGMGIVVTWGNPISPKVLNDHTMDSRT